jgi:hypothetical protein
MQAPKDIRHVAAFVASMIICGVAIWREMQILAIFAFLMSFLTVYRRHAKLVFDLGLSLLGRTTRAKLGDLELQIDDKVINLTERLERKAGDLRMLVDGLNGDHIGWLINIHKVGKYEPSDAIKEKLRPLRNRGLLVHDSNSMHEAKYVWLTALGEELATVLLTTSPELDRSEAPS